MKNLLLLFFVSLIFIACQKEKPTTYLHLNGKTMGTTYNITYQSNTDYQEEIDALLVEINQAVSTYIENSTISSFNQSPNGYMVLNNIPKHFKTNYDISLSIYKNTNGYFDPTVMPLVNYWGFGYTEKKAVTQVDRIKIDSILAYVGFDKITVTNDSLKKAIFYSKTKEKTQLDFSAIAKGYGVDAVGELLKEKGVTNFLVEIGGETLAKGKNDKGIYWRLGINTPKTGAADFQAIVQLPNKAVATSGNYENFFEVDGVKYAHSINPKTGFPEKNTLLSASIFADDCMTADGYATACMIMGVEESLEMLHYLKGIEGYFIYGEEDGTMQVTFTEGVKQYLLSE